MSTDAATGGHCWVAGKFAVGTSGDRWDVVDPATTEVVATVELAGPADVDAAVNAARAAFPAWSAAPPAERSGALHRLAGILGDRATDLARTESRQTGKPIRLSTEFDVPGTIDNTDFFAGVARTLEGRASGEYSADHTSSIRREAIGVVGSIAMKASGFGKDMSGYSFEDYTVVKHVMSDLTAAVRKDWHRTVFTERRAVLTESAPP